SNNMIRNINNALRKNRRILEALLPPNEDTVRITRQHVLERGFNFNYLTHTYTNRKGNTYFFCYDFGYLDLEGEWLLVVRVKKNDSPLQQAAFTSFYFLLNFPLKFNMDMAFDIPSWVMLLWQIVAGIGLVLFLISFVLIFANKELPYREKMLWLLGTLL